MKLSQTDLLLSNINEYHNLLGFLNDRHPEILDEWKSKCVALAARSQQTTDADVINSRFNLHDYRSK
jgi:hypothetical protein